MARDSAGYSSYSASGVRVWAPKPSPKPPAPVMVERPAPPTTIVVINRTEPERVEVPVGIPIFNPYPHPVKPVRPPHHGSPHRQPWNYRR